METKTLTVLDLRPGDEFWADKPFAYSGSHGYQDDPENGDFLVFRIVTNPIESSNQQLFVGEPTDPACVVVGCEYADGARGSRLYKPGQRITIRRP